MSWGVGGVSSLEELSDVTITNPTTGQVLTYSSPDWINGSGGSSGVSSVSNSDGTLTISPTTGAVIASLNLGHANTWTAVQTFGTNISFLGAQVSGTIATGDFIYYNGTNIIGQALAAGTGISVSDYTITNTGVTSAVAGNGVSVSSSTGAVTFSAVLNGTTLLNGTSGLSLNLANTNTWTALQTFTTHIAFSGSTSGTLTFAVPATVTSYSIVFPSAVASSTGQALTSDTSGNLSWSTISASTVWSGIGNPTTSLSLAMGAYTTTFTNSGAWVWDSAAATSTTTTVNSNTLSLLGAYWNGTVSAVLGVVEQVSLVSSTPAGNWTLSFNNNGTLTRFAYVDNGQSDNTYFGYNAGVSDTNAGGDGNSGYGRYALFSNTTGFGLAAFGSGALTANTEGQYMIAVGPGALSQINVTTAVAVHIIGIGTNAGYNYTGTERNNIIIGYNTATAGESNMIRIGSANSGVTGQGQVAFSQVGLVGLGLSPIYGSAQGVAISTSSTVISSFTPTATGTYRVCVTIECKTASTLSTITVTYTGSATSASMTQTLATSVALTAGTAVTYIAECYATTATAVSVQATAAAASDLYGTATIERMA